MAAWMRDAALVVGAYLIGSVPFGYIFAKAVRGIDIRTEGSGNIGATNVGRVLGRGWGIVVFVLDVLKGFVPVLTALLVHQLKIGAAELPLAVVLTGLAAIAGHNWPVFLRFKGGKGVATSCGVFVAVFPLGLLISLGVWVLAVAITRYVSVGSMLAGIALLVSALLLQEEPLARGKFLTAFTGLAAVLSIVRHRSNIRRLIEGTENKIGKRGSAK